MHLLQIQELRDQLEKDLTIAVRQHLNGFKHKTGLMPDSVNVDMLVLQVVGAKPENVFDRVRVRLEL